MAEAGLCPRARSCNGHLRLVERRQKRRRLIGTGWLSAGPPLFPRQILRFHVQLMDEECPPVGSFADYFRRRFSGAMTRTGFDANEDGRRSGLCGLQGGGEFEAVRGHDTVV